MADTNKELSDAEIATKTGFGETAEELDSQDNTTDAEEAADEGEGETTEDAEQSADTEEKETDDEKPVARQKREVSKDDEDTSDDSNDSEDKSEEDDAEDEEEAEELSKSKDERTVPYSLLKSKNAKIKQLQADLAKRDEAKESGDKEDVEEANEEVEASAKELAEELGMDKEALAKFLKVAVKLSSKKSVIPKDIAEKLKTLDELQAQNKQSKEIAHFNKEWETLDIKKQYPNAPKAALKEAQELMDELAHSKDHHMHDLDYILYKNKSKFDALLKTAVKGKSGEQGKRIGTEKSYDSTNDDEENLVDIEDLNPQIMKEREEKEKQMRRDHLKDKDYRIYNPKERD